MLCGAAALATFFLLGSAAWAQGVRYDNIVLNARGLPIAGANVAVCTIAASTSTTPCAPLAPIFSDRAETQPLANPVQSSGLGNYGFFASPGSYLVQLYGPGLTTAVFTVTLPCDPSAANSCSMIGGLSTTSAVSTGTLSVTGNIAATGAVSGSNIPNPIPSISGTPTAGDCVKWGSATSLADQGAACGGGGGGGGANAPADAVQYVSPTGNDANSGLSWSAAKQTLYGAWSQLATNTAGNINKGGTIFVTNNVACSATSGAGFWLMGGGDPNFASPPAGWITNTNTQVRIVGVGTNAWGVNGHEAQAQLACGNTTTVPLWISSINTPIAFENVRFSGGPQAARIGVCSTGATTNCGLQGATFRNVSFTTAASSGGPVMEIGDNCFWLFFYDDQFELSGSTCTTGVDACEAVVLNPSAGSGVGDRFIFFHDTNLARGDIKFYPGSSGGSLLVDELTTESQQDGKGAVWLTSVSATVRAIISKVAVADAVLSPTPAVEVDGAGPLDSVLVSDAEGQGQNVTGPATVLSQYPNNIGGLTANPLTQSQIDNFGGKTFYQTEAGRRLFTLVASRFTNLVPQLDASWSPASGVTLTNVAAPDGTNLAVHAAGASGNVIMYGANNTWNVGDYAVAGAWVRAPSSGVSANLHLLTSCTTNPTWTGLTATSTVSGNDAYPRPGVFIAGDGEWEWFSGTFKVATASAANCFTEFRLDNVSATAPLEVYAPLLFHISAGTISDTEAAYLGLHTGSYPDSISPPVEATLRAHPIAFGGSGDNFFATLDHTLLTSNQTYTLPAAGGTLLLGTGTANTIPKFTGTSAISSSALSDTGTLISSTEEIQLSGTFGTTTTNPGIDYEPVAFTSSGVETDPRAGITQIFRGTTSSPVADGHPEIFTEIVSGQNIGTADPSTAPAALRSWAIMTTPNASCSSGCQGAFAGDFVGLQTVPGPQTSSGWNGVVSLHVVSKLDCSTCTGTTGTNAADMTSLWVQIFDLGNNGSSSAAEEIDTDWTQASRPYASRRGLNIVNFPGTGTTAGSSGDSTNDWGALVSGYGYGVVFDNTTSGGYTTPTRNDIWIRSGNSSVNPHTTVLAFEATATNLNFGLDFRNATFNGAGGCCAIIEAVGTANELGRIGTVNGSAANSLAGSCLFSSSTTCSVTFDNAYNNAPRCFASSVNAGAIAFQVSSTPTGITITAPSSISATANYFCVGNTN